MTDEQRLRALYRQQELNDDMGLHDIDIEQEIKELRKKKGGDDE